MPATAAGPHNNNDNAFSLADWDEGEYSDNEMGSSGGEVSSLANDYLEFSPENFMPGWKNDNEFLEFEEYPSAGGTIANPFGFFVYSEYATTG